MNSREKVMESNRIEGIGRTTKEQVAEHERFVNLPVVTVDDLVRFVSVYQPNAKLRNVEGLNVRVGNHNPPPGGWQVERDLRDLLDVASQNGEEPWDIHVKYEMLHPFTDGNGRSGRALWYWMMRCDRLAGLGFLHAFYYQTLRAGARL